MEGATDAVLIVSETDDLHADALASTLREHHGLDPIRLDLRDFPSETGSFRLDKAGTNRAMSHIHGLDDVRAVWWRRPHPCKVPTGVRAADDEFRQAECDGFLQGMLWSIPAYWVNDPAAERTASRKIVQLETAQRAGFTIPETLITNDPDEARSFVESRCGPVVYKRTGTGRGEFSETRIITRPELNRLLTRSVRRRPRSRITWRPAAICGWCGSTVSSGVCALIHSRGSAALIPVSTPPSPSHRIGYPPR